jgi:hypothetical protein
LIKIPVQECFFARRFFHEQAAVDAKRLKIKTYKDPQNTIEKYPKIITATTIKKT